MKRFYSAYLFLLLCFSSVTAQNSPSYRFDNIDLGSVRVEVASPVVPDKPNTKHKELARHKTKDSTSRVELKKTAYVPYTAGTNKIGVTDNFTTGDAKIDSYILDSGKRHGVDPTLLYAIMHQESSFKQRAVSHKGAAGLMQLMPGTAARFGIRDRFNPRESVEGGARYMRFLLNFFDGSVPLALAGYNAGEGAVLRYGRRVPPYRETQDYVSRITRRYNLLRDPQTARTATRVAKQDIAPVEKETIVLPPTPVYERAVYAVRLPDGKLRLVSE